MKYVLTLCYAVLLFFSMILIHEFGHFISSKVLGVKVNEFSIGMGPALFKRQKGETLLAVRLFPIGGYCALEGETSEDVEADKIDPRSFLNQPFFNKVIILIAGSFMNVLFCVILLVGVYLSLGVPFIASVKSSLALTGYLGASIFQGFKLIFSGAVSKDDVMGIVGMASLVSEQAKTGLLDVTYLMAMLSVNLGIMNMLPIPALDGGRIFILILKKLSGGRITDKAEAIINLIGMVLLLILMVFLIINDTLRLL